MQASFYLPALISSIYITVTVALHKVGLTYPTCSSGAMGEVQNQEVHHSFIYCMNNTFINQKRSQKSNIHVWVSKKP